MIFGVVLGLLIGGFAAHLQLQEVELQADLAISVGAMVGLFVAARMVRGWGLLIGLAGVAGMWALMLSGGWAGDPAQMLEILQRRLDGFPERMFAFIEDISHYTSRYDLNEQITPEMLRMFWGAEAFAFVVAGLAGGAAGKRALMRQRGDTVQGAAKPARRPQTKPATRSTTRQAKAGSADAALGVTGGGKTPWVAGARPARAKAAPTQTPAQMTGRTQAQAQVTGRAERKQPVPPTRTQTVVRARPERISGKYVN